MHATGTPTWVTGIDDAPAAPTPGDAWTLSWDGTHEGIVVIAQVRDDFILGIPVTDGTASATEVTANLNGAPVVLWPQAETGLGTFLLHQRLGTVLAPDQLRELRLWAADRGELHTLDAGDGPVAADTLQQLLRDYQRRCFIEWPSEAEATIDVAATGLTARQFHEATGIATERVLDLWGGQRLTEDELAALGDLAEKWTTHAADAPTRELASPEVKRLVLELCSVAGVTEREARNRARSAYALAARTDSVSERAASRAADTLMLLIQENRDS